MTAKGMVLPLLGVCVGAYAIYSLVGGDDSSGSGPSSDPLEQASVAFEGRPARAEVQGQLDRALDMFDLARTDENYSRAGSVLVTMRQRAFDRGCRSCTEMAILDHMIRSRAQVVGMEFSEAAAWSTEFMIAGDR